MAPSAIGSPSACEAPLVIGNHECVSAVTPLAGPELFDPRHPPTVSASSRAPGRNGTVPARDMVGYPICYLGTEQPRPAGIFVATRDLPDSWPRVALNRRFKRRSEGTLRPAGTLGWVARLATATSPRPCQAAMASGATSRTSDKSERPGDGRLPHRLAERTPHWAPSAEGRRFCRVSNN